MSVPKLPFGWMKATVVPRLPRFADFFAKGLYRQALLGKFIGFLHIFARLFGPQRHFAFPFGSPKTYFSSRQVRQLRGLGAFLIWSPEARPFRLDERRPGAVLPRFTIEGARPAAQVASMIAARSMSFRARGTPHDFSQA